MSLYQQANTLCNDVDIAMMKLNKEVIDEPCIIGKDNPYDKMYNLNKAFKHLADARGLLRELGQVKK